ADLYGRLLDAGRKRREMVMVLLGQVLKGALEGASRELLAQVAQRQGLVPVSVRHLNRLRVQWMLNRPKGRPRHAASCPPVASGTEVVPHHTPSVVCGRAPFCPLARPPGSLGHSGGATHAGCGSL